jgi:hypothetical protein
MTESDWLTTTTRPADMLRHVRAKASARKLQLISCGCARLVEQHLSKRQRQLLETIERHADASGDRGEYDSAVGECRQAYLDADRRRRYAWVASEPEDTPEHAVCTLMQAVVSAPAAEALQRTIEWTRTTAQRATERANTRNVFYPWLESKVCGLFREVIGNPFAERVVVGPGWERSGGVVAGWMTRVGETARLIAAGVQAEQAFDRLPILADALEDDGCTDAELLAHLRGPGPHVRGCWAVDVVLGKG